MFKHISQIVEANKRVLPSIKEAVIDLLPGGKIEGHNYVALNPTRADKSLGSFRIDLISGKWIDFATKDKGKDVVSLYAYVKRLSQSEASRFLLQKFGNNFTCSIPNNHNIYIQSFSKPPKPPQVEGDRGFPISKVSLKFSKVGDFSKAINFDQKDILNFVLKIWDQCEPAENTLVVEYLASRGYKADSPFFIPDAIRYHPKLYHSPTQSCYPAMVALITKAGRNNEKIGIHRTYLAVVDGEVIKAPISPNKMILGKVKSGSVNLSPYPYDSVNEHSVNQDLNKKLIITEGIETGLSIMQATSLTVWAVLSANNMQNIILPSSQTIEEVVIAADNDEAGIYAAERLACRLLGEGYKARIATPLYKAGDFNDLLLNQTDASQTINHKE